MIRQRGTRWQALVSAPSDSVTGKRRQLTAMANTKTEARKVEAQLRGKAEAMRGVDFGVTVAEAAERWWASNPQVSATTKASYRYMLDSHILPVLGPVYLKPQPNPRTKYLRPLLIRSWLDYLIEEHHLSGGSVRKARTVLSALVAWCVAMEMADSNPVMKVPPPPLDTVPRSAATIDECVALLAEAEAVDVDYADYLWLAMEAGGRRGETLGVRWLDLDLDAGTVTLNQSVTTGLDGTQVRPRGKKAQGRTVALSDATTARFIDRRDRLAKLWASAGGELADEALVFSGGRGSRRHPLDGQPWQPRTVTRKFEELRERAGVRPDVDLHGLRRGMISELLAAGVDPRTVMNRAGHASSKMTMEVYGRLRAPADAAAAETFSRLLADGVERAKG